MYFVRNDKNKDDQSMTTKWWFWAMLSGFTFVYLQLLWFIHSHHWSPAHASLSLKRQGHPKQPLHKTREWYADPCCYKSDFHWWPNHQHRVCPFCGCIQKACIWLTQIAPVRSPPVREDLLAWMWRSGDTTWQLWEWLIPISWKWKNYCEIIQWHTEMMIK